MGFFRYILPGLMMFTICNPSFGLLLRDGDTTDNARFLGFPNNVSENPDYAYSEYDFTGVGWEVQNTNRQFVLVSPQHFVCATHFRPDGNDQVRFLGADGNIYTYGILNVTIIQNSLGQNTDLSLGTLEEVVDTRVITPMRWANFTRESQYSGEGVVFGRPALTGNANLLDIVDPDSITGLSGNFANTRFIRSIYQENAFFGDSNDAYLQSGDSGSPVFIISGGELGLVGTNSLISNATTASGVFTAQSAFATFVPEYISDLDLNMSEEGYQMSPLNPESSTLNLQLTQTEVLQQGGAGTVELILTNAGDEIAGNVSVTIQNATQLPDSLAATDYFNGLLSNSSTEVHTGLLFNAESSMISLSWDTLPSVSELTFEVAYEADEFTREIQTFTLILEPAESLFNSFTGGLIDSSELGDDDGDGISNLFEYALGGDVSEASRTTSTGLQILPTFTGFTEEYVFLRRPDAEERGLRYTIQTSTTLEENSWIEFIPELEIISDPGETGFELVTITLPNIADRVFYRLLVTLAE